MGVPGPGRDADPSAGLMGGTSTFPGGAAPAPANAGAPPVNGADEPAIPGAGPETPWPGPAEITPGAGPAVVGAEAAGFVTGSGRSTLDAEPIAGAGWTPAIGASGVAVAVGVAGSCPGLAKVDGAATTPLAGVVVGCGAFVALTGGAPGRCGTAMTTAPPG
jgi:hypothetical protein